VIVVGVDHSEGAKEALRFAFEEAQLRGATLRVVHAWQFGYIGARVSKALSQFSAPSLTSIAAPPKQSSTRWSGKRSLRRAT
jgi:nucleotide-binding universal stress UspA family protein